MADPIVEIAARTTCAFDNLRPCMRSVFYRLVEAGNTPTHWVAGLKALSGYEALSEQNDPPVTTFKGLPGTLGIGMETDRLEFRRNGEVVGVIARIS
jgi:hypothetical protein